MRSTTSPRVVTCQLANILVELGPTAVVKIASGAMPRSTSDRKTPWLLSTGVTDSSRWTLPAAFGWEGVERSEFMSSSVWKGRQTWVSQPAMERFVQRSKPVSANHIRPRTRGRHPHVDSKIMNECLSSRAGGLNRMSRLELGVAKHFPVTMNIERH